MQKERHVFVRMMYYADSCVYKEDTVWYTRVWRMYEYCYHTSSTLIC